MVFSSFKVLNVPLAIKTGVIDLEDIDASLSAPNAILGSQNFSSTSHPVIPRIYVSPSCETNSNCSSDFPHHFQPISMRVKPLGFIEKERCVVMEINGWELDGIEVVNYYGAAIFWGGPGYVGSFRLGMAHWGQKEGEEGRGINVLEVKCYVYKGKENKFVIDDLVVSILDGEGGEE
jgi:hypothetical protein